MVATTTSIHHDERYSSPCRVSLNAAASHVRPRLSDQTRGTCNAANRFAHAPLPPYFDLRVDNRTAGITRGADVECTTLIARLKAAARDNVCLMRNADHCHRQFTVVTIKPCIARSENCMASQYTVLAARYTLPVSTGLVHGLCTWVSFLTPVLTGRGNSLRLMELVDH